jgi:hypothetical protein
MRTLRFTRAKHGSELRFTSGTYGSFKINDTRVISFSLASSDHGEHIEQR